MKKLKKSKLVGWLLATGFTGVGVSFVIYPTEAMVVLSGCTAASALLSGIVKIHRDIVGPRDESPQKEIPKPDINPQAEDDETPSPENAPLPPRSQRRTVR